MAHLPWEQIQTVLLDMDGTLLDLHFDNYFWLHHLPQKIAEKENKPVQECEERMRRAYAQVQGKIEWYCLDYWAEKLDLDIMQAKREVEHLISFRPDAIPFLDALRHTHHKVVLVTNAHPKSLSLKVEKTQLDSHIDTLISTHQFGVTKESPKLWQALQAYLNFDPATTLFVDDSQPILDTASQFGIAYTLGVANPDSKQAPNQLVHHPSVTSFMPLVPEILACADNH